MALIGGLIAGGISLIGDSMAQSGQQQTNAQQTANMMQQEQWQEQMSDTAMQRRVTDLDQAGLNPMLAVGSNGAQVGSVGQPSLQNPDASFSNLGAQATNAISLGTQQAQIQTMQAQAAKANADAAVTTAQLPYTGQTAQAALDNLAAKTKEAWNNSQLIEQNYAKAGADLESMNRNNNFQQQFLELRNQLAGVDLQRAQLGMPKLENDSAWQQAHPVLSGWLQSGSVGAAGSVVNSASKVAGMIP